MKKLILTALVAGVAAGSVMAQGVVTFTASGTFRPIQYTTDGVTLTKVPIGSPAQVGTFGNLNVAFYFATAGTTLSTTSIGSLSLPNFTGSWAESDTILSTTSAAGGMNGTSVDVAGTAGGQTTAQVEIVGWTGSSTTFAQALAAAQAGTALIGWGGSTLSTGTMDFLTSVGSTTTPAGIPTGAGGYNGLVLQPVPEPTTLALGGLGAAALLLFRRRK